MTTMITKAGAAASIERSSQIWQKSCGDGDALGDCAGGSYYVGPNDWKQPASDATQHWHDVQTIAKELAEEWKLEQKSRAEAVVTMEVLISGPAGPVLTSRGDNGAASPEGTTPDLSTLLAEEWRGARRTRATTEEEWRDNGARRTRATSELSPEGTTLSTAATSEGATPPDLSTVFFDWDKSVKLAAGHFHRMAAAAAW